MITPEVEQVYRGRKGTSWEGRIGTIIKIDDLIWLKGDSQPWRAAFEPIDLDCWFIRVYVCENCGDPVDIGTERLAREPYSESILLLCPDCYHDGPPEPPEYAAQPREA
jgi:hypothetical protein